MSIDFKRMENLFPVPLWEYSVPDHEALNPRLLEEIGARQASDTDISGRNRRGWQSRHDFFVRSEPAHAELAAIVRQVMRDALSRVAAEIAADKLDFLEDGWVNVNPPHGYVGPHVHPNSLLSGTYYASIPQGEGTGGAIEFLSPHATSSAKGWIKAAMLNDKVRVKPANGVILLFPSHLMHWVLPNDSEEDRVTVSFNLSAQLKPGARLR